MLPLEILTHFVHKAAFQLHDLCLAEGARAELAQLGKFTELLQALGMVSFVKELHGSDSEDVVKDSTQHNYHVCFVCLSCLSVCLSVCMSRVRLAVFSRPAFTQCNMIQTWLPKITITIHTLYSHHWTPLCTSY